MTKMSTSKNDKKAETKFAVKLTKIPLKLVNNSLCKQNRLLFYSIPVLCTFAK